MSSAANNIQMAFVQRLKNSAPQNVSLADEVAELLKISNDSAYRRLRGETAISIDEAILLCNHFKIPFGSISENLEGLVTFSYQHMANTEESFYNYLKNLDDTLLMMQRAKEKNVTYAAVDIPILHHLGFTEIGCFKMFYWMRSLLGTRELEDKKFDISLVNADIQQMARSVYRRYNEIPSLEVWTDDLLFTSLRQVEYCWDSGVFKSKDDALAVCQSMRDMVKHVQKMAEKGGKKYNDPDSENQPAFTFYHSELLIGNNTVIARADNFKAVFLSHHTFNNISTTDYRYCKETEDWLDIHIKKSALISGTAEKQRLKFFNTLYGHIEATEKKIKD